MYKSKLFVVLSLLAINFLQCFCDINTDICRDCEILLYCHEEHKNSNRIPIYPPDKIDKEIETGKCYCANENIEKYKSCIMCHYNFVTRQNPPSNAQIDVKCKKLLEGTPGKQVDTKTTKAGNENVQSSETVSAAAEVQNPSIVNGANTATNANDNTNNVVSTGTNTGVGANNGTGASTMGTQNSTNGSINSGNNGSKNNNSNGKSKLPIILSVIGAVLAAGVIGFLVYNNKKKSRPESMPFFGNTATSPRSYATLDIPKDSTSSLNYANTVYSSTAPLNYDYNQNPSYDSHQYGQYGNDYQQYEATNDASGAPIGTTAAVGAAAAVGTAAVAANDNSINYDPRRESLNKANNLAPLNDAIQNDTTQNNNTAQNEQFYSCTYPYDPKLDDELELRINDEIQILEEFEDGWMKAYNRTTNKEGMAPIVCVKPTTV